MPFTKEELEFILEGMKADRDREDAAARGEHQMTEVAFKELLELIGKMETIIASM